MPIPGNRGTGMEATVRAIVKSVAIAVALGMPCCGIARADEVWRLGVKDGDYREFAIAGDYPAYASAFHGRVSVDVRRPDAARLWPFIHPGPADAWAGSRKHRLELTFTMDAVSSGVCRLDIGLVNTHQRTPPVLSIAINGRTSYRYALPTGGPDGALTDPKQGKPHELTVPFPARFLRTGLNKVGLEIVSGSWMLYDYIALHAGLSEPPHPRVRDLSASSTMLYRKTAQGMRQVVQVFAYNDGIEGRAILSIRGGVRARKAVALVPGPNIFQLDVNPVRTASEAEVALTAGSSTTRTKALLKPERRWTVYAVPSSHTDIGYTDVQENAIERHLMNTVGALEARKSIPGFRWNLEVALHADLIAQWRPDLRDVLDEAVRSGDIGIQGLYLNMLTGLCTSEEMIRVLARATAFRALRHDAARTASLNDVPTAIGTLPMLLKHSGYSYFIDAVNEYRGPVFRHADARMRQCPFWWEGPDGSRVLTVLTHGYAQMGTIGLTCSVADIERALPAWLRGMDRPEYPGTAAIAYGAFSDNVALSPEYARIAREWNRRYAFPRIVLATATDFFRHVERESGKRIPVFAGDMGSYWEDGAASSAHETAVTRHARARLSSAQRLLALHATRSSPSLTNELDLAWKSLLFYNEHTWGAWCSISAPYSEQTLSQWRRKKAFADEARTRSQAIVDRLGSPAVARPGSVVRVWNAHAWKRDIEVTLPLGSISGTMGVEDVESRQSLPSQLESHDGARLVFVAQGVPPFGYRDCRIVVSAQSGKPLLSEGPAPHEWASPDWRLRLDPATGSVASLIAARTQREWIQSTSGHLLNQFLYVAGGEGSALINQNGGVPAVEVRTHTRSQIALVENGPVRAVLHVRRMGAGLPAVETYVIVHADGQIEFRNIVHHRSTTAKEAAYFAFPFALNDAQARSHVDVPMGVVEADRGQLPGACREWYACSTFAAVSDSERTAMVLMSHGPLVTIGDIFRGKWRTNLEPSSAVYAYVLNNYWDTNYRANQDGPLTFGFTLRTSERPFDAAIAWRAGNEAASGMADPVAAVGPRQSLRLAGTNVERTEVPPSILANGAIVTHAPANSSPVSSLLEVSGAEVIAVEPRGDEIVVHLLNLSAAKAVATLRVPGKTIRSAIATNLVGESGRPLHVGRDGAVAIPLGPHAPAAVSLRLGHGG